MIIDQLGVGGRERRLVELLKGVSGLSSVTVRVVVLNDIISFPEVYDIPNVTVIIIKRKIKKDPSLFFKFFNICREFEADVIHSWGSMSSVYAVPAAKLLKIKFVNAMITNATCTKWGPAWWRAKFTFPFSDVIVSNSQAGLKAYKAEKTKSRVIRNGFNSKRNLNLRDARSVKNSFGMAGRFVVGMVGAFHPRKDYYTFLEAAGKILELREDVTFVTVGSGETLNSCKSLIKEKNKSGIIFCGQQSDVESIINVFDIGVLATNHLVHEEGISNAIMEYMGLGKPVIATRGGGTSELVRDGSSGIVIKPGSGDMLVEAVTYLLDNPEKAKMMGRKGQDIIQREFGIETMVNSTVELYTELLNTN